MRKQSAIIAHGHFHQTDCDRLAALRRIDVETSRRTNEDADIRFRYPAKRSACGRMEGGGVGGMALADKACGMDFVIDDDEYAEVACRGRSGDPDGWKQVRRPGSPARPRFAHRRGEH